MNDIEFIETLKQKRNACDYSQSRLAQELQISRQNLNEIENGKTKASFGYGLVMNMGFSMGKYTSFSTLNRAGKGLSKYTSMNASLLISGCWSKSIYFSISCASFC